MTDEAAEHLKLELRWLDLALERQVLRTRALLATSADAYRGLYIADATVDALIQNVQDEPAGQLDWQIAAAMRDCRRSLARAPELPLRRLQKAFGLDEWERAALLVTAAPELDARYMTLYGYVQNGVTRRLATVDLVLKLLCTTRKLQWQRRESLSPSSFLLRNHLIQAADEKRDRETPLLLRSLAAAPRIIAFLLGETGLDPDVAAAARFTSGCEIAGLELPQQLFDRAASCT